LCLEGYASLPGDFAGDCATTNQEFELGFKSMRRSNFALRLQPSLLDELRRAAEAEGVALNQLINVAVAEKVSALRTEDYFRERGCRADRPESLRILERAGAGNAPMKGDEMPAEWQVKSGRKTNGRDPSASERKRRRLLPSSEGRQPWAQVSV